MATNQKRPVSDHHKAPTLFATTPPQSAPQRHHLDRRAAALAQIAGDDDELLNTRQLADWLGVCVQWAERARHYGFGPKFTKLGPRFVRYRTGDVRAWLEQRAHASTSEYRGEA
jgi:predicted DNA-binding transcriptional regulator AlpA